MSFFHIRGWVSPNYQQIHVFLTLPYTMIQLYDIENSLLLSLIDATSVLNSEKEK